MEEGCTFLQLNDFYKKYVALSEGECRSNGMLVPLASTYLNSSSPEDQWQVLSLVPNDSSNSSDITFSQISDDGWEFIPLATDASAQDFIFVPMASTDDSLHMPTKYGNRLYQLRGWSSQFSSNEFPSIGNNSCEIKWSTYDLPYKCRIITSSRFGYKNCCCDCKRESAEVGGIWKKVLKLLKCMFPIFYRQSHDKCFQQQEYF